MKRRDERARRRRRQAPDVPRDFIARWRSLAGIIVAPQNDEERRLWAPMMLYEDEYRKGGALADFEHSMLSRHGVDLANNPTWRKLTEPAAIAERDRRRALFWEAVARIANNK